MYSNNKLFHLVYIIDLGIVITQDRKYVSFDSHECNIVNRYQSCQFFLKPLCIESQFSTFLSNEKATHSCKQPWFMPIDFERDNV